MKTLTEKVKIRFAWAGFAFVIFHSLMIFIYAMPEGILPEKLVKTSSNYVFPVFQQKWNMFAPCPLLSHHVEIKYYFKDGDSTNWISPSSDAIDKHMVLRGSHHGDLAVAEYNLLYWVNWSFDKFDLKSGSLISNEEIVKFKAGTGYYLARNYAFGNSIYLYNKEPLSALMRCDYYNVKTEKSWAFVLPEFNWK